MTTKVVIPSQGPMSRMLKVAKVASIVSNRIAKDSKEEQFLVQWQSASASDKPPLSWHNLSDLFMCLELVQDYLDARDEAIKRAPPLSKTSLKRKAAHFEADTDPPISFGLSLSSRSPSVASTTSSAPLSVDVYNGVLDRDEEGLYFCRSDPDAPQLSNAPTPEMVRISHQSKVDKAYHRIRAKYVARLNKVPGKPIHLVNTYDQTSPSLRFRFIPEYILREGVNKADPATQEGCQSCSPHMGRCIGCEYTQKCECLEYAAVNEAAITDPTVMSAYREAKDKGNSLAKFPKRFPYYAEGTKIQRAGTLVPFYLDSRRPIYECNDNCRCGLHCRNKNVQFGRTIDVEIFKTDGGRGWGLRCPQQLYQGQFIDTYRGEVITDTEATLREETAGKAKASYLYSLDKFGESEGLSDEQLYVVDGEFFGGPTKFMNHSCEPNCRQYTVSYNKHDPFVYDIAFFACRDIPAGEELTFDYLDKEEGEPNEDPGPDAIPCLCGASKCRKWLWT
ncbi:unnamed protein product [Periconia digitata]|uniref:SET domain-containing protein n=1 Tax=Periconia digitata TaxID=1303443 RepID=A0A9W4XGQ9_9PLEO|nr:unnamed protein product [Periconia digitata]